MIAAIRKELALQRDYLQGASLASIYLGGGTPSVLSVDELNLLFRDVYDLFPVDKDAEVTLEANPDDLTREKLFDMARHTPVNRLSIGIQSFTEADLQWMNRAHNAEQAHQCLRDAAAAGFHDLSLDLIYGCPPTSDEQWRENVRLAFDYGTPHLSCYCLTVEEGTALHHFVKKGQSPPVDEDKAARQFEYLIDACAEQGYEHYEISNFALPGRHARHNSSYWRGQPYLGVGPAAHSFDGHRTRQWNIAHNPRYITALENGEIPCEREALTDTQRYNEWVLTALRTQWGLSLDDLAAIAPSYPTRFLSDVTPYLQNGNIVRQGNRFSLSRSGKMIADRIAVALFLGTAKK